MAGAIRKVLFDKARHSSFVYCVAGKKQEIEKGRSISSDSSDSAASESSLKSPFRNVEIPDVSLPELLFQEFYKWPRKVAFECSVTKRKYTFDDLRLKSRNLAKSLRHKLKLQKGDVVAVLLQNIPEFPIILLAAFQSGIITTTINPLYTAEEISRQLIDADAKAIFTMNKFSDSAKNGLKLSKKNIPIITIKTEQSDSTEQGTINVTELMEVQYDGDDLVLPNPDDMAVMPYSSGTTGLPKGVKLSHRNLVANILQIASPEIRVHLDTTDSFQDTLPAVLPMFHIYGHTNCTLYPMRYGMKVITLPKFTPDLYISVLQNYNPTILFVVPPIVNFLTKSSALKTQHLSSVRVVFSGAAPLGALDEMSFLEKAKKKINMLQGYGLSETSPVISFLTPPQKERLNIFGTVGSPIPNTDIKIIAPDDPTCRHLKPHEKGELLVRGPQVMEGYHNRPEETTKSFHEEWFRTGDLAYYDENNMIFIADRLKELIKVKGFQVAPAELEELIRDHPQVEDVAVIGVPHENYGEVPRAYVIPKKNAKVEMEKLNDYLAAKVANYKLLRGGVAVVDSIPKNTAGKILRRELKEMYAKEKI